MRLGRHTLSAHLVPQHCRPVRCASTTLPCASCPAGEHNPVEDARAAMDLALLKFERGPLYGAGTAERGDKLVEVLSDGGRWAGGEGGGQGAGRVAPRSVRCRLPASAPVLLPACVSLSQAAPANVSSQAPALSSTAWRPCTASHQRDPLPPCRCFLGLQTLRHGGQGRGAQPTRGGQLQRHSGRQRRRGDAGAVPGAGAPAGVLGYGEARSGCTQVQEGA